jgi:23S rRNA pseudouridine1911/1915/1917 synthase
MGDESQRRKQEPRKDSRQSSEQAVPEGGAKLTVPAELGGARLDKALVVLLKVSRSRAKALLDAGVRVNGRRAPKGANVNANDVIEVAATAQDEEVASPEADPSIEIDVRHLSDSIVVVHKPAHLATAPLRAGEKGTLVNGLLAKFPEIAGIGDDVREPGLLHRLDNDTSGLLVVARTEAAWEELRIALRAGQVHKRYLAIVAPGSGSHRAASVAADGSLPDRGEIDIPIAPHPKDSRRVFACVHPNDVKRLRPREARTTFEVLERWETSEGHARALVLADASRALRHQIRVHFAALGAPLLGDGLYGGPGAPALGRHALHASRVEYVPGNVNAVEPFVVEAALPEDMAKLLPEGGAQRGRA